MSPVRVLHVERDIPAGHPAFAGHFPGRPLLPGVLLLAEVMEALAAHPDWQARLGALPVLSAAKFFAPVEPGHRIAIDVHDEPRGLRFEIHRGDVLTATGQFGAGSGA